MKLIVRVPVKFFLCQNSWTGKYTRNIKIKLNMWFLWHYFGDEERGGKGKFNVLKTKFSVRFRRNATDMRICQNKINWETF